MRRRFSFALPCVVGLVSVVSLVSAARGQGTPVARTLDALLPGGADAGGLVLDGWRYSDFSYRTEGAFAIDPSDVGVRIVYGAPSLDGRQDSIHFTADTTATAAGQTGTLYVDYRVDAAEYHLNRAGLRFTGAVPSQGTGVASARVVETLANKEGTDVQIGQPISTTAVLEVFNDGPGRLDDTNSSFMSLNVTRGLLLRKEITLAARESGPITLSVTDTLMAFPEPAATALAFPATLGLLKRRRGPSPPGRC